MKRCCLWVVTAVLLAFSIANLLAPDYDAGEYMLYALTLGAALYAAFFQRAEVFFRRRGPRAARWALRTVLFAFAVMIAFLAVMGNVDTAVGTERAVVVLGAPLTGARPSKILMERMKKAAAFLHRYPVTPAVLSGGQVPGEDIAEAEALYQYLTDAGIDGARLIRESDSQNTRENFCFSLALLERRGLTGDDPVVILTNSFHCYRARRYAERAGFRNINILPCYTDWADCPTWYLREAVAVVAFWITGQ